LRLLVF